jgi:RHS repeat-associated protein
MSRTDTLARSDSSGTYQYFYANPDSPFQLSAARDPAGVFSAYYYDPSGALFAFKRGTSTYYVASDHLGTPRVVTDATGTVIRTTQYDSYGQVLLDSTPTFDLPVGFAGGIPDNTGLIRFGFRDYEPATGRWVSRDPIFYDSGQANLYQYVINNPINRKDPTGLIWVTVDHNYLGVSNWLKGIMDYVTDLIGAGMDPIVPGADPSHYTGMQRDVIQEWQHDPKQPCRDSEHPIGSKRKIRQTYTKFINPGPSSVLINDPEAPFLYQWLPWVNSPTYE